MWSARALTTTNRGVSSTTPDSCTRTPYPFVSEDKEPRLAKTRIQKQNPTAVRAACRVRRGSRGRAFRRRCQTLRDAYTLTLHDVQHHDYGHCMCSLTSYMHMHMT